MTDVNQAYDIISNLLGVLNPLGKGGYFICEDAEEIIESARKFVIEHEKD